MLIIIIKLFGCVFLPPGLVTFLFFCLGVVRVEIDVWCVYILSTD